MFVSRLAWMIAILAVAVTPVCVWAQGPDTADAAHTPVEQPEPKSKHVLFLIPNFRTSPTLQQYAPLPAREKFKIASQDSFDRGTIALAAAFAGESQMTNANKSFGQGVEGYAKYFGAAYTDFVVGNFMTEGVYPTLLHQDPRYFRRATGSKWSRMGYAVSQIFVTHGDNGHMQVNYSELLGNSTAVAISMSYYKDNRTVGDGISKLGSQLSVDMASNVLKEFWPDISRKFSRQHKQGTDTN
ncbi:MAG: hypothetical protein JO022_01990 [Acidobacteriaceae bacterium]|nr:hypothetical protein [Acidobacteriaceae bacterium]